MSNTIKLGIDLGTTNSAVVINHNGKFEIIKNSDQMDYTPSVFGFSKGENIQVGQRAYEQLFRFSNEEDIKNYKAEIKRLMGTNEKINFDRVSKKLSPEEISSEILKYLKESVARKYADMNVDGVVITVPAYFDTIQKEATKKAGELAGFKHVVLIQEPIAGAIAYGFDNNKNENWLVYDLGGGTFDVAVVSSKDLVLTIKGHGGDNYLGGKDFDNLIIDEIIVPKIKKLFSFENPERSSTVYNLLKGLAEVAKKDLTDRKETNIIIDNKLILDDSGNEIEMQINFSRDEFESIISKLVEKSIQLSKNAIKESGLSANDIHRIILIGGPTQIPYIRNQLEKSLGIEVDTSMDPLTVVARGACIFGSSQVIPKEHQDESKKKKKIGSVKMNLTYEPMVSDEKTTVFGVLEQIPDLGEYYIQIQSEDGKYSSSKIKLKNGKFFDEVYVPEGKSTIYFLYLTDEEGTIVNVDPDSFTITHGLSIAGTPISHNVSVALNKKTFLSNDTEEYCEVVFERGSILPLEKTNTYRTTRDLKKGDNENALPIKIYEGESKKPDRNKQICQVTVSGVDVPYNLPEGTEVNLTINLSISNELSVSVYFPGIDLLKTGKSMRTEGDQEDIDNDKMREEIGKENDRLEELSDYIPEETKNSIKNTIKELHSQTSNQDSDTQRKTSHQIKELKKDMDKHELETESTRLIKKFNEEIKKGEDIFSEIETPVEFKQLKSLKLDGETAIKEKNRERLESVNETIEGLINISILNTPEGMKHMLGLLYQERNKSTDPIKSNEIFNKSLSYVESNNVEGMKQCIRKLLTLMPQDIQKNLGNISGITK